MLFSLTYFSHACSCCNQPYAMPVRNIVPLEPQVSQRWWQKSLGHSRGSKKHDGSAHMEAQTSTPPPHPRIKICAQHPVPPCAGLIWPMKPWRLQAFCCDFASTDFSPVRNRHKVCARFSGTLLFWSQCWAILRLVGSIMIGCNEAAVSICADLRSWSLTWYFVFAACMLLTKFNKLINHSC